jgi:type IV pilus assembly protein PilM
MLNLGAVWGIDAGFSALKAVKLKIVGKSIVLLDFRVIRYSDLSGEPGTRREGMLPQAIAALQQDGLGRDRCIVSIAPQMVFNRFIPLPPVDKRRIPELVLYEAKQQIPFNLNEVVWAYEPIRKQFVLGEEIEIGLFAAKREVIEAYLAELSALRQQLYGVQVSPLALLNFIRHEVTLEKPTVVIDVGAQSTNLLILDGQRFWLRNLPIAGNSFTATLEKRLNIPHAEAEKLKYTVAESRHRRRLIEVLRPVMRDLVAEIQRSIGYYKSLSQAVKFEEILVIGEGYKLFGLDRFLVEQLQYQITPIHELRNIAYQGDPARLKDLQQTLPSLGVAIGLGLQGLNRASTMINLLPENFIIQREVHSKRFSGLVAGVLIWAIIGCLYASGKQNLRELSKFEDLGQSTLDKVTGLDKELKDAMGGKTAERAAIFQDLGRRREHYARLVGAISAVIPREIQIDSFKFSESVPSGALPTTTGAQRMTMMGKRPGLGGQQFVAAPTPEGTLVSQAGIVLTFTATCEAEKEPSWLQQYLPQELAKAVIYPAKISAIKTDGKGHFAISVSDVKLISQSEARPPGALGAMVAPAAPNESRESAVVMIGLITAQEADTLLAMPPEQRATPAKGKAAVAASAATTAGATQPTALPQTAPGRLTPPAGPSKQ